MSQKFTERWERRKWYLIRSLFDEKPMLSPIPETQELASEQLSTPDDAIIRPYSPLPDLIIEKEPNRHDEPEEYYQALEKKIIKFYRKLFLDTEISSQYSESENSYINFKTLDGESAIETVILENENMLPERYLSKNKLIYSDKSVEQDFRDSNANEESVSENSTIVDEQSQEEELNEINKTSTNHSTEVDTTTSESQSIGITETLAVVNEDSEINNRTDIDSESVTSPQTDTGDSDEQFEYELLESEPGNNEREVLDLLKDGSMLKSFGVINARTSQKEVEVMRSRKTSNNSIESVDAMNVGRYFSEDVGTDERLEFTAVREMEEAPISSPELSVILETISTSKRNATRKHQIIAEISPPRTVSPPKRRKFENRCIQTSFNTSDNEESWQEIQKYFFEGSPFIFNLCSCSNHVCC